ncbi:MAG TPA: STAS domain-containing protein, partial [Micromonosporaceae bacterium]
MPLVVTALVQRGTTSLNVAGDIDLATEPDLWNAVEKAVTAEGVEEVVVDLAKTTFMDCFGMGALIRGRRLADDAGVRFRVANPSGIPLTV